MNLPVGFSIKEKLQKMNREAEERNAQRTAGKTGLPYADLTTAPINIEALALIEEDAARTAKIAAFEIKEKKAALAVFDPNNEQAKKIIEELKRKGYEPSLFVVSLSGLKHVFSFYRFVVRPTESITDKIKIKEKSFFDLSAGLTGLEGVGDAIRTLDAKTADAGKMLEIILIGALVNRASDVHLEPETEKINLRFRIDGLLHDVRGDLKKNAYLYLLSRIKLLSGLKLNVHDKPQDGRFTAEIAGKEIEIRVAVSPSEFGETAVLRVLDPAMINISLSALGPREDDMALIEQELKKPNGMILITGPTGSGKTTTLYAFLKRKKTPELKIITIEDPIEYHLEGIEQTQVEEKAGYSFVNGLKSLMRQDPDIILVGEIRDKETAEIGLQAALTGHLVFSTVHTNNAAGAVPRLLDLGVRASSIGPALNVVIAQRLVRLLCEKCKKTRPIDEDLKNKIAKFLEKLPERVDKKLFREAKIFEAAGCANCNNLGYKGRIGIFELLIVGSEMEDLINKETSEVKIQDFALKKGMVTMQQDGVLKVIGGITSFEEVEAATGPLEF